MSGENVTRMSLAVAILQKGEMGFFDVENRYAALDAKHDPLVKINAVVPWEAFRSRLEQIWRKPVDKRKCGVQAAGRHRHVQGHHFVRPLHSVG